MKQKIEESIEDSTQFGIDLAEENHYVMRKVLALLVGSIGEFFGSVGSALVNAEHYLDPDEVLERRKQKARALKASPPRPDPVDAGLSGHRGRSSATPSHSQS